MFSESQLLPLSALQHLLFCERQCALIHIEGLWAENRLTIEGRHVHNKAHDGPDETRRGVRIARGLPIRSFRLGLVGQADVVEFHPLPPDATDRQSLSPDTQAATRQFMPYPIEYKRGRPKRDRSDEVQLCAQALCLEEMLDIPGRICRGALYYWSNRRRLEIEFDDALRQLTHHSAQRLHEMLASGVTPKAKREPKCDRCSMLHLCLPGAIGVRRSAAAFLSRELEELRLIT